MKTRAIPWLVTICLLAALFTKTGQPVEAQRDELDSHADLRVIESTTRRLILELDVPAVEQTPKQSSRGPCQSLTLAGWGLSGAPGEPALPVRGALVGVPPGSKPNITVLDFEIAYVRDGIDLCPAASLVQSTDFGEIPAELDEQLVIDPAAYTVSRDYPGPLVQAGDLSMIRSQQVVQVLAQPFQYDPAARRLTVYTHLRIQVEFDALASLKTANPIVDEGAFEEILRSQIINYEAARAWRVQPEPQPDSPARPSSPSCKITVNQEGMVSISYETLQAACPQIASQNPQNYHLYNQDTEVSIQVLGEADGTFDGGDSILFYGQKTNSRYTNENVYWLTTSAAPGIRMNTTDGTPENGVVPTTFLSTIRIDENHIYSSKDTSGSEKNHWFWELINSASPRLYSITLTNINLDAGPVRMRGLLKGYTASPQHHIHISINGHLVYQEFWPARSEIPIDIEIPSIYLVEGANIIQVECPLTDGITINQVLVDWFEITYARNYIANGAQSNFSGDAAGTWLFRYAGLNNPDKLVWDITDPLHPISLTNVVFEPEGSTYTLVFQQTITAKHQYLAASFSDLHQPTAVSTASEQKLRSSVTGADYIMITHPNFAAAIQPLAEFYTDRGLRVKVVNVQDVYDEFSGGVFTPEAIRDFLAYAYTNWPRPAPSFVLLVGDGNVDFLNNYGRNDPVLIPPYLADVDPWMGETDADNRFVAVSGTDILPDMALGRLPAKTAADVSAAVQKILSRYQHLTDEWINHALFAAGANDPNAGNFPELSNAVINTYFPAAITIDQIYYGFPPINSGAAATQAISSAINSGRGLVHYAGHSNPYTWFGIVNKLETAMLNKTTVQNLSNVDAYPIFISMTCFTGYFVNPGLISLDEALINAAGKGAAAVWSPTGQGVASGHDLLDAGFFSAVYQNSILSIGTAANQAKYYLYANSSGLHRELIDTYILFGDPAMLYKSTPTDVNLINFHAGKAANGALLSWETSAETTLGGFHLYRREPGGEYIRVNTDLIPPQKAGQNKGSLYTYLDTGITPGIPYEYRLDAVENSLQVLFSRTTLYWPFVISLPLIDS